MNNFQAKTIVYNKTKNNEIPYKDANDISLKANQIIYTSVNNNFQKMVNNDLYIQKKLLNKQNYTVGPKVSSDIIIKNASNGYKVWDPSIKESSSTLLKIYQKEEIPVVSTLTSVDTSSEKPVFNSIFNDKTQGLLAGSETGLYKIDSSFDTASKYSLDIGNIKSTTKNSKNENIVATRKGVYRLNNLSTGDLEAVKVANYTDTNTILNISGSYDILRGTGDGIYSYKNINDSLTDGYKNVGVNGEIYSTLEKDNSVIAISKNGVYKGDKKTSFVQKSVLLTDVKNIKKLLIYNDKLLIWTNSGLYTYKDNTLLNIIVDGNINSIRKIDGFLYIAIGGTSSNKGIHNYDTNGNLTHLFSNNASYDIVKKDSNFFITTSAGVFFTKDFITLTPLSKKSEDAVSFGRLAYLEKVYGFNLNKDQKVYPFTSYQIDELEPLISEEVIGTYANQNDYYIATKTGIYNSSLQKGITFNREISRCNFTKFSNNIYALTDNGVYNCSEGYSLKDSSTNFHDIKTTDNYIFSIKNDTKQLFFSAIDLEYTLSSLQWTPIYKDLNSLNQVSNILQIEVLDDKVYILSSISENNGQLLILGDATNIDISRGIYQETAGKSCVKFIDSLPDYNLSTTSTSSNVVYNKFISNSTGEISAFTEDIEEHLTSPIKISELPKADETIALTYRRGSPIYGNGYACINLKKEYYSIIHQKDGKLSCSIISAFGSTDSVPEKIITSKTYDNTKCYNLTKHFDSALSGVDTNIVFLTHENPGKVGYLSHDLQDIKIVNSQNLNKIHQVKFVDYPENKGTWIDDVKPPLFIYGKDGVHCISANQDVLLNNDCFYTLLSNSDYTYLGNLEDESWKTIVTQATNSYSDNPDDPNVPVTDHQITAYSKGMYHIYGDSSNTYIYKTYYTLVNDTNVKDQFDMLQYYLSSELKSSIKELPTVYYEKSLSVNSFKDNSSGYIKATKIVQDTAAKKSYIFKGRKDTNGNRISQCLSSLSSSNDSLAGTIKWKSSDKSILSNRYCLDFEAYNNVGYFLVSQISNIAENVEYESEGVSLIRIKDLSGFLKTGVIGSYIAKNFSDLDQKTDMIKTEINGVNHIVLKSAKNIYIISPKIEGTGSFVSHKLSIDSADDYFTRTYNCEHKYFVKDTGHNITKISYNSVNNTYSAETITRKEKGNSDDFVFEVTDKKGTYFGTDRKFDVTFRTDNNNSTVYIDGYDFPTIHDLSSFGNANKIWLINNILFVLYNNNKIVYQEIGTNVPFSFQLNRFNNFDLYRNIGGDFSNIITLVYYDGKVLALMKNSDGYNFKIIDYSSIVDTTKTPTAVDLETSINQVVTREGITINNMDVQDDKLVFLTSNGVYEVDLKITYVPKDTNEEISGIVNITKIYNDVTYQDVLAIKTNDTKNVLLTFDGTKISNITTPDSSNNLVNIQQDNDRYYLFCDKGIYSTNSLSDEPDIYDERLSGTYVSNVIQGNKYIVDNNLVQFETKTKYSYSKNDFVDLGIPLLDKNIYQYDSSEVYIEGDKLSSFNGVNLNKVEYNDEQVIKEYDNFEIVKTSDDIYYKGQYIYQTEYTVSAEFYTGNYLAQQKSNKTYDIHNYECEYSYVFNKESSTSYLTDPFKVIDIEGKIMVACPDGWYLSSGNSFTKVINGTLTNNVAPYCSSQGKLNRQKGVNEINHLFVLNGNEVYKYNPKEDISANLLFKLDTLNDGYITTIYGQSEYKYLFGTSKQGVYYTYYDYNMIDHNESISKTEISEEVNKKYDEVIADHILNYHESDNSTIKYINDNLISPDLQGIEDGWNTETKSGNFTIVKNDLVQSVKFDSVQNPIKVEVLNKSTGNEYVEVSGVTFIYKKWTSGQKELYINIPTTNTYYEPHLSGINYCRNYQENVIKQNTNLSNVSNISTDSTSIKVTILRKAFDDVKNFSNVMIEGQSLPLKIYKDTLYDCVNSQNYFHSTIKKSVFCKEEHEVDNIILYFKCFGTDEQSLKLQE